MSKNIVSSPMDGMKETTVTINGSLATFMTNVKFDELDAVMDNWEARTDEYTVESLVDYINSKSHYGFKAELIKPK